MGRYGVLTIVFIIVILFCTGSSFNKWDCGVVLIIDNSTIPASVFYYSVHDETNTGNMTLPSPSRTPMPEEAVFSYNRNPDSKTPDSSPISSARSELPEGQTTAPPEGKPSDKTNPPDSSEPPEKADEAPNWYANTEKGLCMPVLMYHNLLSGDNAGDSLNVSEMVFEDQIRTMKEYGYNTITFEDLYNHYMNGVDLPENPIIITFDDGYKSNYTIGFPILEKYGLKACVFIITEAIGNSNNMSRTEIQQAVSSGVLDIQSHSESHSYTLSTMKEHRIRKELSDSKKVLEDITGKTVNIFCYPFGKYSNRLIRELSSQGYVFSVTTSYGCVSKKSNPMLLPRIRVNGCDSGKALKNKIEDLTGRTTVFVGIPEETITSTPIPAPSPSSAPTPDQSSTPTPLTIPEPDSIPTSTSSPSSTPILTPVPTPAPSPSSTPTPISAPEPEITFEEFPGPDQ